MTERVSINERIVRALTQLELAVETWGRDRSEGYELYIKALSPHGIFALAAIEAWPLRSKKWPELAELVADTQDLVNQGRIRAMAGATTSDQSPVSRFIRLVVSAPAGGDGYATSWLNPDLGCRFGERVIYTTPHGVERLSKDFGKQAKDLGVSFEIDPQAARKLTEHVAELRATGRIEQPRRGRAA